MAKFLSLIALLICSAEADSMKFSYKIPEATTQCFTQEIKDGHHGKLLIVIEILTISLMQGALPSRA